MYNVLRGFDAQTVSNYINPYAVDVIRAKRRDLVYGISHTEDLLDLLVTEGVMTAAKRSIILTIGTRTDQNSRVLDILEARGERACRKFFHPCLMLAEPDLYQRVRTYVEHVNKHVKDTKRQLIGYLLEKEKEGMARRGTKTLAISQSAFDSEANEKTNREDSDCAQTETIEDKAAQGTAENLMYTIATDGDLALLEELLDDTNINSVTSSGETLLHVAAKHGHLSITELLIRKGARIDLHDNNGRTALHDAASRGHTEIVRSLLNAGAPMYSVDLHNKTPIHLAAENEHHGSVKALVKEEKEEEQTERQSQDTFLHMAAVEDNWRLAELLLQSGATVDARNNRSQTALFYAVARGNENTVAVLLRAGAKVDGDVINEAIKRNQESILHLLLANAEEALSEEVLGPALFSAVKQNQHATVTVLTDNGENVNVRDKRGYTPLLLSAELGHTEVFRVLLAKQAKIDATLSDLSSALHLAVHSGSLPIVQTLLEKGLDPNVTGPKAQNPLHLAAQCNRSDLVGVLVKAGAQVNAVAQDGLTPLHLASQLDHADTVIQLLQNKADSGLKDRQGRTALHWAASCHGGSRVVDLLLSAKADPAHTDNKKKAALHLAAMAGNLKAVNSLLSRKAKGDAKDMDGSTALHYAAAGGHACVVSALLRSLSNKKGIEERNAWRKTPLQAAAEKGHDSVAVLLLEAGAKVNTTDHSKDTPLHCAARGGHQEVVKRLVNWGQAAGQRKVNLLKATNNVGKTPLQVAESGDTAEHEAVATLLRRKMFLIK